MMIIKVYNFYFSIFPQLSFFHVRVDDKAALLLYLLRNVVKPQEQTVVFAATKHHVEYLKEVRYKLHFSCTVLLNANSFFAFINECFFFSAAADLRRCGVCLHLQFPRSDCQKDQYWEICASESHGATCDWCCCSRYRHPPAGQRHQLQLPLQSQTVLAQSRWVK